MAHDVFISYTTADRTVANAVCARLEEAGVRCWIAPRDVTPGEPYAKEIVRAIPESRIMVLIFSGEANRSPQVLREVERAVDKRVAILPFRVEDVAPVDELEFYIKSQHWLDAITPPLDQHIVHLVNTVKQLIEKWGVKLNPPTSDRTAWESSRPAQPAEPRTERAAPPPPPPPPPRPQPVAGTGPWDAGTGEPDRRKKRIAIAAGAALVVAIVLFATLARDTDDPRAGADHSAVETELAAIENQRQVALQRTNETDARAYIIADSILAHALARLQQFRGERVPTELRTRVAQIDTSLTAARTQVRTACAEDPTTTLCPAR